MNREISSASRIIGFQQIKRNWIKHEERLMHIKPTINTRPMPQRYLTSRKCNYSKSLELQLQNKSLLKKLTDRVEHRNEHSMCSNAPLPKSNRKRFYQQYKKKCEDQGLYKRLKQIRPMIDTDRMLSERKITEKYLNTISKFGYKGLKPNKTQLKFDFKNNELKYLSKRRILVQSRVKQSEEKGEQLAINEGKIIEEEYQKQKRNRKLLQMFRKPKTITIDNHHVQLKITQCAKAILLQLRNATDKQNTLQPFQLEVKIENSTFESQFKKDLQLLLKRLRYNQSTQDFYIL